MEKLSINSRLASLSVTPASSDRRSELIFEGSVLTLEYAGRAHNQGRVRAGRAQEQYSSLFQNETAFYSKTAEWSDEVLYFCARKANELSGRPTDRADRRTFTGIGLSGDPVFMNLLSGILGEVLRTVTPPMVSDLVGEMCTVVTVPRGKTYEMAIESNAVIRWYDSAHTALRSVPQDSLYHKSITLNPQPVSTRFVLDYYQMTGGNGNLVQTIAAVAAGYAAQLMQKFTAAFTQAAGDAAYVPAALSASGYNPDNWAQLCQNVARANHVRRDELIAYGDFNALRKVLPGGTFGSSVMTSLGDEYFRNGYLTTHDGVRLFEISPTSTPETANTTLQPAFPTDLVIIAAKASSRTAPMVMAFEEDSDAQISLTPAQDVLATGRIEGLAVASFDIAPAFASRIGVMKDIV